MTEVIERVGTLERLREAGIDLETVPESQREVFATLSEEELEVLVSVRQRIEAVTPDWPDGPIEPQSNGNAIF